MKTSSSSKESRKGRVDSWGPRREMLNAEFVEQNIVTKGRVGMEQSKVFHQPSLLLSLPEPPDVRREEGGQGRWRTGKQEELTLYSTVNESHVNYNAELRRGVCI